MNDFNPGDKFKLKDWVSFDDVKEMGYDDEDHIDYILDQEFFITVKPPVWGNPKKVFYKSQYHGSVYHFNKTYCELVEKAIVNRGHPLTNQFKREVEIKQEVFELK
jgi:hypothetical protein